MEGASRLSALIRRHETELLADWIGQQSSPIGREELREQARAFLAALCDGLDRLGLYTAEVQLSTASIGALDSARTLDAISDGIAVVDAEGRIAHCNQALGRMLGREPAELVGGTIEELRPAAAAAVLRNALSSGRREGAEVQEGAAWYVVTADPISSDGGPPTGAVCIVNDATRRRELEEQFRESQKLETIGTLAAGVAHDFNNLLTSVLGNASLALSEDATPRMRERLEEIVRASQRAADLTRQLLAYSGQGRHFVQRVNLADVLRGMRELIASSLPKKVTLETAFDSPLPPVEADVNQLRQLAMNLVGNAAEAIGDAAGVVRIKAFTRRDGGRQRVALEVSDTGCGMTPEVQERMFDPFFTTKFTGRGLGLSAVAGIARGHGAQVQVTSKPGEGSTFTLLFPAYVETSVAEREPRAASGGETILVVDDEAMVRQIAQAALEARGYRVLLAANGREAIDIAAAHPEVRLVLLDLTMPVMSGEEALGGLLEVRPDAKVLLSTGYDSREAAARLSRKGIAGWLQKPYTSRQLSEEVRLALAADSA